MIFKELLGLKPGTFIKGIRLIDYSPLEGRCATLDANEWHSEVKEYKYMKNYTLRTPWYSEPTFEPMNAQQAYDKLLSIHSLSFLEQQELDIVFPEEQFKSVEWASFEYGNPVGIHLGTFFVSPDSSRSQTTLVFTKLLRCDGEVGYIALVAQNINNKDLELL